MKLSSLRKRGRFLSKQLPGMINYRLFRRSHFKRETRDSLIKYLENTDWDYLIISGDLTTLSMPEEFEIARDALEPLIKQGPVLLTTGNHDCYTPSAQRSALIKEYFGDLFPFDLKDNLKYFKLSHNYLLYEIDQAIPRHLFSSQGKVRVALKDISDHMGKLDPGMKKIVMGHYPVFLPDDVSEKSHHQLENRSAMKNFLVENDVRLYLHGHLHKSWSFSPDESPNLVNVNSGGCCRYAKGIWSGFHRITLNEKGHSIERVKLH